MTYAGVAVGDAHIQVDTGDSSFKSDVKDPEMCNLVNLCISSSWFPAPESSNQFSLGSSECSDEGWKSSSQ